MEASTALALGVVPLGPLFVAATRVAAMNALVVRPIVLPRSNEVPWLAQCAARCWRRWMQSAAVGVPSRIAAAKAAFALRLDVARACR